MNTFVIERFSFKETKLVDCSNSCIKFQVCTSKSCKFYFSNKVLVFSNFKYICYILLY